MRPSLDYLDIPQRYTGCRVLWGDKATQRDYTRDCKSDCGEEAEDVLETHKRRMHLECVKRAQSPIYEALSATRRKGLLKVRVEM
jgi:hypothetical protein